MKKVKGNAAWNGLSRTQRATLEHWLFEEGLSYNAALDRARSELGFTGSKTSLRRFYERARSERLLSGLMDTGNLARTLEESDVSVERLRNAGLKLAAEMFLRSVAASPQNMKEWAPLAKLLLQAERNESWRRIKEEENEIRERTLELARERFQHAVTAQARKEAPEQDEAELSELEENKLVNHIRRGMFGPNIPGVLPETEYELAHPEILEAKEKEAWARQMAIYARKREEREQEALREKAIKDEKLKVQNGGENTGSGRGARGAGTEEDRMQNDSVKDGEREAGAESEKEEDRMQKDGDEDEGQGEGNEREVSERAGEEGMYYPGGGGGIIQNEKVKGQNERKSEGEGMGD